MKKSFCLILCLVFLLETCSPGLSPANLRIDQTSVSSNSEKKTGVATASVSHDSVEEVQPTITQQPKNQAAHLAAFSTKTTKGTPASVPAPISENDDFIASEIMGRPTDSSITINIVPAAAMTISYEYGTAPGAYTFRTAPQHTRANAPIETCLEGLQANTRYYYRLIYDGKTGVERSFVTQRTAGSTFTFDIQGDSHPEREGKQFNADLYARTLLSAAGDQPDFYMTIGDDFSVDALKRVDRESTTTQYINQRQWLGMVGAPIFLVNGNHEQASLANLNDTAENVSVWAQTARNDYYPQPAPDDFYSGDAAQVEHIGLLRDYYAFTWGDALFVVIDPYWHSSQTVDNRFGASRDEKKNRDLWNVTLGDEQYDWFKNTLEGSTARYKFVFTHHVLGTGRGGIEMARSYEWGDEANLSKHRPGWEQTIQQLMAANHVTIFFQGHDHLFARQELDGVIYQTLPTPADPKYAMDNAEAYKTGDKLPASGHVRVTVSPSGVAVDYIRSYLEKPDEVAFSYTVE